MRKPFGVVTSRPGTRVAASGLLLGAMCVVLSAGAQGQVTEPPGTLPGTTAPEKSSPDGVEVAGWNAGAVLTPSDPAAWGGERASFGGDGQPLSQRVASYDLQGVLDPKAHTVEGKEKLRWLNRSDRPIKSLYFHLYLNAFEGSKSTFATEYVRYGGFRSAVEVKKGEWGYIDLKSVSQNGQAAPFVFVHPDGGPEADRTVVRVDLPEAVAPGATAEIDVEFHDQLPRVVARTGYFDSYHLIAQWFPKVGVLELPGERGATAPRWNCHEFHLNTEFYADFGNYRAELTAPKEFLVRATGVEQGTPKDAGGGALLHTFAQDDVHDFVWTAWDGYAPPLHGAYDGPGSPHVDVEVLYPAERERSGNDALAGTVDSLRYFSESLGPYPYPHVTVVVPPYNADESGGMEYETFFTTVGSNGMFAPFVRYVTVHEFGHGYFMGLLASNEFEEPFLDEGMNEFWDSRMLANETIEVTLPQPLSFEGVTVPPIHYWDFERLRGTERFQPDPIAGSSWDRFSRSSYGVVYPRTVMVFHDLEAQLGSESFGRGMKLYYKRWHHRHPGTADLREALAEGSGQPDLVRAWFQDQVVKNGPVDDRVVDIETTEVVPTRGTYLENGKRVEKTAEDAEKETEKARADWKAAHGDAPGPFPFHTEVRVRRYAAHVPQQVVVTFEDGKQEALPFPVEESWHRYLFDGPQKVKSVQLDPSHAVQLDIDKLDDGRTREPSGKASSRWSLEVTNLVSLVLSLLVTE